MKAIPEGSYPETPETRQARVVLREAAAKTAATFDAYNAARADQANAQKAMDKAIRASIAKARGPLKELAKMPEAAVPARGRAPRSVTARLMGDPPPGRTPWS